MRRSSKVGLVLVFTLLFGTVLGTLPAFASAASTAFVNVHNVLAGQAGKVFTIRVNNTESAGLPGGINAGKTINEVRIRGPVDLIDAVLAGSAGPSGFTNVSLIGSPPAEIRFTGGNIAPGANATFTVVADVRGTPARDLNDVWRVRSSSNGGQTHAAATSTGEGLLTDVRVLQVQNVAVVAPTGAADDRDGDGKPEVTGTQGNICVRTRVANAASTALDVTPSLSAGSMTIGAPRPAAGTPCSAAPLAGGSASIPSHGTSDFDFLVSADNVSSSTASELVGTASAPNASTPSSSDPDDDILIAKQALQIEPKADLTYVTNTLNPRAVVPGATGQVFTININKGPAGSPPVPTLNGTFTSAFGNTTLASPTSIAGGTANSLTATFAGFNIAPIADGRYQPTVSYGYTDANGLVQALVDISAGTKPDLEQVRLDHLIPDIHDLLINAPAPQVTAVPPVQPAVTNGTAFTASASVTDTSPETSNDTPCGPNPAGSTAPLPCTLEAANLIQYPLTAQQGGGAAFPSKIDVKPSCTLSSSGSLSCNITTNGFTAGTFATALEVSVKDETGSVVTEVSPLVDVDIISPFIQGAKTHRGGTINVGNQQVPGQRRTIEVTFNEPVETAQASPQDWTVQDGSTVAVCNVGQSPDKRTVTLTTCQELDADTTGTITYAPRPVVGDPYHDRVGKDIVNPVEKPLLDGIEPLAPTFDTVEGRGTQDDSPSTAKYFFNTTTPAVHMIQTTPASADDPAIANGYTIQVYEETDGTDGLNRLTDRQICGDVATADSITLTCDFSGIDRAKKVYGLSIDGNNNIGQALSTDFVLDRVRPQIGTVTVSSSPSDITVNFTERVPRGDDFSGNWTYIATRADGQRTSPDVETVSAGSTNSQRVIGYADQPYSPATLTPNELRYDFNVGNRYEDRAGNLLLDIHFGL
jgi:hypothetical protein